MKAAIFGHYFTQIHTIMALGDGIRRNIAHVDPTERVLFRKALVELNKRFYPGNRTDTPAAGHVSLWFKQDEIHKASHVHNGPEFVPWHRELVNYFEGLLRQVDSRLSMHYWDWTQDPRAIPNANLGGGTTGTLNLFTPDFMGYGGSANAPIGEPWLSAGFYGGPGPFRDDTNPSNAADAPELVNRDINGSPNASDAAILMAPTYQQMWNALEDVHDTMHGYVNMGGQHLSFRDPFVYLLHSNVDRLYAQWQTTPGAVGRLDPNLVYGADSAALNVNLEPWSTGVSVSFEGTFQVRPWYAPESQAAPKKYKHPSIIFPPCYDTNGTATPIVEILNPGTPPTLNFTDVPSGETTVRAAIFRVYGCGDVTVRVQAGGSPAAPFSVLQPIGGSVTVHHGSSLFTDVRIWIAYTAGAAGVPVPNGSVTFECPENGNTFTFSLHANAVVRPRVVVALALDQSGSMADPAGTSGATRLMVLKDAARAFMEVVQPGNGVGLIRFDNNSYAVNDPVFPGLPVTRINAVGLFDPGRVAAIAAANAHAVNPLGSTSVGDGVDRARQLLNALPAADYDQKALLVLTDGLENDPLWIADVLGSIDNRTFAIGLGNEQQVNTTALKALTNGTGGYLLLTGLLSSSIDDYFRLTKYFLQILAGITNLNVILDPSGYVGRDVKVRIPFHINEADIEATAVLLTDEPVVDYFLEAPDGTLIDPAGAAAMGIVFSDGAHTKQYHIPLPVAIGTGQHAGRWHVVLTLNAPLYKRRLVMMREKQDPRLEAFMAHGARYSVVINTRSNLKFAARLEQTGQEPGASLQFRADLSEYGLPVVGRAAVQVELARPLGSLVTLPLTETEPGVFEGSAPTTYAGIYSGRLMAKGTTLRGTPFTRETTLTGAVWPGGNTPYTPPVKPGSGSDNLCRLLTCILSEKNLSPDFEKRLKEQGISLQGIRECVKRVCKQG